MSSYTFILLIIMNINILTKKIIDVEYIDQTEDFPTGCESVSTVMCLKYHRINVSVNDFIDNYLETGEFYFKDNQMYAPDPNVKFVGTPYDKHSYGCYEPVIEKALNKVIEMNELNDIFEVKNLTDVPMKTIIKDYIDNDMPVIFWATMNFVESYEGSKWIIPETGEHFTWRAKEHCLLLVGYDEENYIFNDPWENHGVIGYEKTLVEKRHKEQYSMAVSLVKKN